jgi:hypothetical protein
MIERVVRRLVPVVAVGVLLLAAPARPPPNWRRCRISGMPLQTLNV